MKWLLVVLVGLFIVLQYRLWVGEGSMIEVQQIRLAIAQQQQENEKQRMNNQALDAEVADLKGGLIAVEERARSELGMIREGETFFQVADYQ